MEWNERGVWGVEKGPITPPVDRVKCVLPKQSELKQENFEVVKNVVNFKNENVEVLSTSKTVGKIKKRTWTKLSNGLFGWKTKVVTTSNSSKKTKDKSFLPAIKGVQKLNISTGTSPLKINFGVGSNVTGLSSESESLERDYLAKKPRMHGGNQI